MSYKVIKEFGNDYYCCCRQTWTDDPEYYDTLEEAEEEVLDEMPEYDLESVKVYHEDDDVYNDSNIEPISYCEYESLGRSAPGCWIVKKNGVVKENFKNGLPGETWKQFKDRYYQDKIKEKIEQKEKELQQLKEKIK